jgi:hypothetical protein
MITQTLEMEEEETAITGDGNLVTKSIKLKILTH